MNELPERITHKKGEIIGSWTLNAIVKKYRGKRQDVEWEAFCKCGRLGWIKESQFHSRRIRGCGSCVMKRVGHRLGTIHNPRSKHYKPKE